MRWLPMVKGWGSYRGCGLAGVTASFREVRFPVGNCLVDFCVWHFL